MPPPDIDPGDRIEDGDFRDIVASLPAALYTTDADGWITYFNEAAANLWGRSPVIGDDRWCGSWRLFWLDGTPMAHEDCPMAVTVKTEKPVRGAQAIAERPDGSRFNFTPFPTPMFNPEGRLTGAFKFLIEISCRGESVEIARRFSALSRATGVVVRDISIASLFDQTARMVHRIGGGLSPVQWAILRYLLRSAVARSEAEIANFLGVAGPSFGRDVSLLRRHGFIGPPDPDTAPDLLGLLDKGRFALDLDPLKRLASAIARLGDEGRTAFADYLEFLANDLASDEDAAG